MARLTGKQQQFIPEYLIDCNATAAAERSGYSPKTAYRAGQECLKQPVIRAAIDKAMAERAKRNEVTQDMVIQQLRKVAFSDMKDFVTFGPDGVELLPDSDVDGTIISEVSETVTQYGGTKRIKLGDKLKALELLGKHLNMFRDNLNLTGDLTINVNLVDDEPPGDN